MKKRLLVFAILLLFLFFVDFVSSANCGGATQCNCGDTLVSSQTMWYDLINCGSGLIIGNNGVTLDCNIHIIDGTGGGTGITATSKIFFNIENCEIREFNYGLYIVGSSDNNIFSNTVSNNNYNVLLYDSSENNLVSENEIEYSGSAYSASGVYINGADNNRITQNKIRYNPSNGVFINSGQGNTFWNNEFVDNGLNAYEEAAGSNNLWNFNQLGNFWDDYELNPHYHYYYEIAGLGNGIDWYPITSYPPELAPIGNRIINEGQTLTINLIATDPDEDPLLYYTNAGEVLPSSFNFDETTGLFCWTPTFNDAGQYEVTFGVTDGTSSDEETITITVIDAIPPETDLTIFPEEIIFSDDNPFKEDIVTITAIFHNLLEEDPDQIRVRFYSGIPSDETLIGEDLIIVTPTLTSTFFAQTEWIPGVEGEYDIHVFVDPLNEVPELNETNNIASKPIRVYTIPDIRIRDSDIGFTDNYPEAGETISILAMVRNIETQPTGPFLVRFYDGNWTNIIDEVELSLSGLETDVLMVNWDTTFGNHTIHVLGDSSQVITEINETNNHGIRDIYVNRAPVLESLIDQSINEGSLLTIDVDAYDLDGDILTFSTNAEEVLPSSFSFDEQTGIFQWIPTYQDAGNYQITFSVSDSYTLVSEEVTITVNDVISSSGSSPIMRKENPLVISHLF